MRAESTSVNETTASAPAPARATPQGAGAESLTREWEDFIQRRIPVLPPAPEENVVAMFRNRSARFGIRAALASQARWRLAQHDVERQSDVGE